MPMCNSTVSKVQDGEYKTAQQGEGRTLSFGETPFLASIGTLKALAESSKNFECPLEWESKVEKVLSGHAILL